MDVLAVTQLTELWSGERSHMIKYCRKYITCGSSMDIEFRKRFSDEVASDQEAKPDRMRECLDNCPRTRKVGME